MFPKSLAIVFIAVASVSALSIDTPEKLTQCGTVTLNWNGKKGPFTLSVLPSCESDKEDPLLELPPMNATSYKWTVSMPSTTGSIAFAITDFEGNEAYTDEVTIGKSDDVACMNAASTSVSSSTSTSASATGTASASVSVGTTTQSTPVPTTLVVSATSAASAPSAPANVGGSSGSSVNSGVSDTQETNGAAAPVVSVFATVLGVAAGIFALL